MGERFTALENRFDGLEGRFDRLEEVVSANASKIDDLHRWMGTLNGRLDDLEGDR